MSSYGRLMNLISKWPVLETRKRMDYGTFLRELIKNKDPSQNVFPGDSAENAAKLDSLYRLLNNHHGNKYPCNKRVGAVGLELKEIEKFLQYGVIEDLKDLKYIKKEGKDKE